MRRLRSWSKTQKKKKNATDKPSGAQIACFISVWKSWINDERVWFIYVNELPNERERNSHSLLVESENFHQPFIFRILVDSGNVSTFSRNLWEINSFRLKMFKYIGKSASIGTLMIDLILGKPNRFQDESNWFNEIEFGWWIKEERRNSYTDDIKK